MFLLISVLILAVKSWDLSDYNITHNYYVSSIASHGNRAFLALPRSSCHNNFTHPTLVEVSWYNEPQKLPHRKKPFFLESQLWENCDHLQDALSLDIEPAKARLWVLDKGNSNCPPKIVIYNLFSKNNYSMDLPDGVEGEKISCLIVDSGFGGPKAYVGLSGADFLLAFAFVDFRWTKFELKSENRKVSSTKFLALSRREPVLFLTGEDEREVFSLNLRPMRRSIVENETEVNATYIGEKLGMSCGLVADLKDGLIYYLVRDNAIVRWDTRNPSEAEYYSVLGQSHELLPYLSQLYTGPQNGIYALVNSAGIHDCPASPPPKKRLVKILKYNIFIYS